MTYEDRSIKETIEMMSKGKMFLPALQRKFVWSADQIECLFDSIMRGYPIGTFLFWEVSRDTANNFVFYKFIQNYHERDSRNEKKPTPEMDKMITGVLDGQQRLTSLFIALQGTYAEKLPRKRRDNDESYPEKQMYFNAMSDDLGDIETTVSSFKFLTKEDAKERNDKTHWFLIKDALAWQDVSDAMIYINNNGLFNDQTVIKNLSLLWQRLCNDKIINNFKIESDSLDKVLDIFVRVNSGGTQLSKSDLLFSTIIATWEESRKEVEDLLISINGKGDGFNFNIDFIMRTFLFLLDIPFKFNVSSFRKENVEKIEEQWEIIKDSILQTIDLLVEFGFSSDRMTTHNIVIPIIYYIFKGGEIDSSSKENIRRYLIQGMLKQVFGAGGDGVLSSLRDNMRVKQENNYLLKSTEFLFSDFEKMKISGERKFKMSKDDIENILDNKKGTYTFLVLSMLYPNIKLNQIQFHQDHLFPRSKFSTKIKNQYKITDDEWYFYEENKDRLSNLQLLEGLENQRKNAMMFDDWFKENVALKGKLYEENYRRENYLPKTNFSFGNFKIFYNMRKEIIREKLITILSNN